MQYIPQFSLQVQTKFSAFSFKFVFSVQFISYKSETNNRKFSCNIILNEINKLILISINLRFTKGYYFYFY